MARPHDCRGGAKPEFARHVSDGMLDALALITEAHSASERAACRLLLLIKDAEAARDTGRTYPRTEVTRGQLKQLRLDDLLKANGPAVSHDDRAA